MNVRQEIEFDRPLLKVSVNPPFAARVTEIQSVPDAKTKAQIEHQDSVKRTIDSIASDIKNITEEMSRLEPRLYDLTIKFSETIARLIFQQDSDVVNSRIQKYLELGVGESSTQINVWVNSVCLDEVDAYFTESSIKNVQINADNQLEVGDCRIETPTSGLIARLDSHIQIAKDRLLSGSNVGAKC